MIKPPTHTIHTQHTQHKEKQVPLDNASSHNASSPHPTDPPPHSPTPQGHASTPHLQPPTTNEQFRRSILKAISWRIIASILTFIITFTIIKISDQPFTSSALQISIQVTLFEAIAKIAIFTFHERTWIKIPYGKTLPKT